MSEEADYEPGEVIWPEANKDVYERYQVQCYVGGRWTTRESYRRKSSAIRAAKRAAERTVLNNPWRVWERWYL